MFENKKTKHGDFILSKKRNKASKYKQTLRSIEDGVEFEVHEYVGPQGSGYQMFLYETLNGKNYVKSIGYGNEAESRTFNWQEITTT